MARARPSELAPPADVSGVRSVESLPWSGFLLVLFPVLELFLVHFQIKLRDALLEPLLHVGDRLVVDDRTDLFDEEAEERSSGDVAYGFLQILLEVPLNGRNGVFPSFFSEFDGHGACGFG